MKEATRVIESKSSRIVHFIFNPMTTNKITSFSNKLKLMLEGNLEDYEKEEHEKFERFLD